MTAEFLGGVDVPLVVLVGQGVEWAIEAESVLIAQFAAEWKGAPPIDVASLWGARWEGGPNDARIVVVSTRGGTRAFSSSRLMFRSVDSSKILPLPDVVARGVGGRFFRGVVFAESGPATLVLNPDAFMDTPKHMLSDFFEGTRE